MHILGDTGPLNVTIQCNGALGWLRVADVPGVMVDGFTVNGCSGSAVTAQSADVLFRNMVLTNHTGIDGAGVRVDPGDHSRLCRLSR